MAKAKDDEMITIRREDYDNQAPPPRRLTPNER